MAKPSGSSVDDVLDGVGPRLRALRTSRGLTLTALAESTGISVSTLSRLESGQRRPTLELLLPLARVHGIALDDLVDAPPPGDPRVSRRSVVRDGVVITPLTRTAGELQAYKQVFPARWPPGEQPEQKTHEGYEWLYVLSGRLRLRLARRDFVLSAGEVVEFDTRVPHAITNPFPEPAEVLSLFGPQGERMHVRARPER